MQPAARSPEPEPTTSLKLLVELVYDAGCPHVEEARAVLTRAHQEAGVPAVWTEWNTGDPQCPASRLPYGSPTILVNGDDVAPGPHRWAAREVAAGPRCRLYREGERVSGAPPLELVLAAIHAAVGPEVV